MPNVTISIDKHLLEASREYARRNRTTLNNLIREMLRQRVKRPGTAWIDECFELMDSAGVSSGGVRWSRDDVYDL